LSARKHVIATASTSDKLDWLLSLPSGATHTVNYKTQDFAAEAKKVTGGKGVDVIIDFVRVDNTVQGVLTTDRAKI
jgi:NADPH:quinone reductase-like Zn-dependent oxidoreductase